MPTYAYRCTACSHSFEIFQKFTDEPLSTCPECGSPVRKVFQPVGIVFKGSGWYINDSRAPEKESSKPETARDKAATATPDSPAPAASAPSDSSAPAKPAAATATAKAAAD